MTKNEKDYQKNIDSKPNRFVSLHNHTGFSAYDGLGYPNEHFEWCLKNGLDAHAITEHGQMNSYAHAQLWAEEWNKDNPDKPFKYIPGCEVYFHPSIKEWKKEKHDIEFARTKAKEMAKLRAKESKLNKKLVAVVDKSDDVEEVIVMSNSLTIENEDETKSSKFYNPINRRHHMVVLPKNQEGLKSIFGAVSEGYLNGFYRFPRIDLGVLKEACKDGNVIVSSACIGGLVGWSVFHELQHLEWDNLDADLMDNPEIRKRLLAVVGNSYELMMQAVKPEDYYLELQFNRLKPQNLVNRVLLEFAKQEKLEKQLIVTCDAHYARPELWKDRELYKKLGYLNYTDYSAESLPKTKDELKCELYPKNVDQIWDEYHKSKKDTSTNWYDDEIIKDAIERTHDIAHNTIGSVPADRSPKYPNKRLTPSDKTPIQHLVKLCKEGLIKRKLSDKQEYIDRLKHELSVIKQMGNADYFISYQKIMVLAREVVLCGPGRGSGGGSLVAYVLYITDLDPIHWDLPFARFLNLQRVGLPDIDCVHENHLVIMGDKSYKKAGLVQKNDFVIGGDGLPHKVLMTYSRGLQVDSDGLPSEIPLKIRVQTESGTFGDLSVVPNHKMVLATNEVVYAHELIGKTDIKLLADCNVRLVSCECDFTKMNTQFIDLTIEDDHRFHIVPFDVIED